MTRRQYFGVVPIRELRRMIEAALLMGKKKGEQPLSIIESCYLTLLSAISLPILLWQDLCTAIWRIQKVFSVVSRRGAHKTLKADNEARYAGETY